MVILATVVITKQRAKYTQLTRYNIGEAKRRAKSIGSVTPVIKDVNAAESRNPIVAILLFLSGIARYIARHTAGSPIIICRYLPLLNYARFPKNLAESGSPSCARNIA